MSARMSPSSQLTYLPVWLSRSLPLQRATLPVSAAFPQVIEPPTSGSAAEHQICYELLGVDEKLSIALRLSGQLYRSRSRLS